MKDASDEDAEQANAQELSITRICKVVEHQQRSGSMAETL